MWGVCRAHYVTEDAEVLIAVNTADESYCFWCYDGALGIDGDVSRRIQSPDIVKNAIAAFAVGNSKEAWVDVKDTPPTLRKLHSQTQQCCYASAVPDVPPTYIWTWPLWIVSILLSWIQLFFTLGECEKRRALYELVAPGIHENLGLAPGVAKNMRPEKSLCIILGGFVAGNLVARSWGVYYSVIPVIGGIFLTNEIEWIRMLREIHGREGVELAD